MKRTYIKEDEFEVRVGRGAVTSYGEVQITYTVEAGRPSRNWTNATDGNFYPSEGPSVEIVSVKYRRHPTHAWQEDTSEFFLEIDEDSLLEYAMEEDGE